MKQSLASLLLIGFFATSAQGQSIRVIDLGPSTQLNGVDPVYGLYGQVEGRDNGVAGFYPFWRPRNQPLQLLPLQAASLSGIDAHCLAGTYTNPSGFNIAGFQQCTDNMANVQFFSFEFGANATIIVAQLHSTETVFGWFDDFHLNTTGFISTPVFDSNGAVLSYTTTNYSVPGALSTKILAADDSRIGGSFETSPNHWSGFIQPLKGGPPTVVDYPGATTTGVTALSPDSYAGYYEKGDGIDHGYVHSSDFAPFDLGADGTWITGISENGHLIGYFEQRDGRYRGFVTLRKAESNRDK